MSECMAWVKGSSLEQGRSGGSFTPLHRSSRWFDMLTMTLELANQEAHVMNASHHLRRKVSQCVGKQTLGNKPRRKIHVLTLVCILF
jgi:hypothetical protein